MDKISLALLAAVPLVACGKSGSKPAQHAVGTYIGGGSVMVGPDSCAYDGSPGVFLTEDGKPATTAKGGPRFVYGPGTIHELCGDTKRTVTAVAPTGAKINGPTTVKVGTTSERLSAVLVANGAQLDGDAAIDWKLGDDCASTAEFAPVMGAQDTGGRDRSRQLVAKASGTCTVSVTLTTGSTLSPQFQAQTFTASSKIAIQ